MYPGKISNFISILNFFSRLVIFMHIWQSAINDYMFMYKKFIFDLCLCIFFLRIAEWSFFFATIEYWIMSTEGAIYPPPPKKMSKLNWVSVSWSLHTCCPNSSEWVSTRMLLVAAWASKAGVQSKNGNSHGLGKTRQTVELGNSFRKLIYNTILWMPSKGHFLVNNYTHIFFYTF